LKDVFTEFDIIWHLLIKLIYLKNKSDEVKFLFSWFFSLMVLRFFDNK